MLVGSRTVVIFWREESKIAIVRVVFPISPTIRIHCPLSLDRFRETYKLPDGSGASAASLISGIAIVADIDFALRGFRTKRSKREALFLGRDAAPNARAVQHTRIIHVVLPTFEEVCHAQHGAIHSCF